jgi:hypothetical protein
MMVSVELHWEVALSAHMLRMDNKCSRRWGTALLDFWARKHGDDVMWMYVLRLHGLQRDTLAVLE